MTVVAPLLLLMYAFHLLWFSPEITGSGKCDPSEFGVVGAGVCGPEHGRVLWLGTFLVFVTVVISVGWYVVQQTWLF